MFKIIKSTAFLKNAINPAAFTRSSSIASVNNKLIKPIDDLNKNQSDKTSDEIARCKLASVYRLVDLKGWSQSIYNHITIRSNEHPDHFLLNPYGLFYSELTASSLVKIDSKGSVIEKGSTTYGFNRAGFTLHSTIHDFRKDVNAVIHVHTNTAAGISALKCGLLPISQEAIICLAGCVGYHDYEGILVDEPMKKKIEKDLGPHNRILILRNHGVAFCGSTIEEAYFWLLTFMTAVDIQFHALAAANGIENLTMPPERVLKQVQGVLRAGGVNEKSADGIVWKIGDMELEAEMRRMDLLGYKTGYNYKKPPQH